MHISQRIRVVYPLMSWALLVAVACTAAPAATPTSAKADPPGVASGAVSAKPTTIAEILTYRGADRQQILEEGARKEGKAVWYISLAGDIVVQMASGFEKKYPFLKIESYRSNSDELIGRTAEEFKAKRANADVVMPNTGGLQVLDEAGALLPYFSAETKRYPVDGTKPVGDGLTKWVLNNETYLGFGYNTKSLPAAAVPHNYRDLMKPELKSKMAFAAAGSTSPRFLGALMNQEGAALGTQLADQDITMQVMAAEAMVQLVASGEILASPTLYRGHMTQAKAKGAPVEWIPLEPALASTSGPAVMSNAPHPYTALLFVDYLLGTEVQALSDSLGYGSAAADPGFKRWYPENGIPSAQYNQNYASWDALLKSKYFRKQAAALIGQM